MRLWESTAVSGGEFPAGTSAHCSWKQKDRYLMHSAKRWPNGSNWRSREDSPVSDDTSRHAGDTPRSVVAVRIPTFVLQIRRLCEPEELIRVEANPLTG